MRRITWMGVAALIAALGCATPAEMRKLQNRVSALEHGGGGKTGTGRDRVAELGTEVEELRRSVDGLNGRLDEVDRQVKQALEEARTARKEANGTGGGTPSAAAPDASAAPAPSGDSQEVQQ